MKTYPEFVEHELAIQRLARLDFMQEPADMELYHHFQKQGWPGYPHDINLRLHIEREIDRYYINQFRKKWHENIQYTEYPIIWWVRLLVALRLVSLNGTGMRKHKATEHDAEVIVEEGDSA